MNGRNPAGVPRSGRGPHGRQFTPLGVWGQGTGVPEWHEGTANGESEFAGVQGRARRRKVVATWSDWGRCGRRCLKWPERDCSGGEGGGVTTGAGQTLTVTNEANFWPGTSLALGAGATLNAPGGLNVYAGATTSIGGGATVSTSGGLCLLVYARRKRRCKV